MPTTRQNAEEQGEEPEEEPATNRRLYKEIEAPEAVLRIKKPKPYINSYYKIELTAVKKSNKQAYVFIINDKLPQLLFLEINGNITRLQKLINAYTKPYNNIQKGLINLLEQPKIIQDTDTTKYIVEVIYKCSLVLNLPIYDYIAEHNTTYNDLIIYYFTQYKTNQNKQEAVYNYIE